MHLDSTPLFPQGIVSRYHNDSYSFDSDILDKLEYNDPIFDVKTTQTADNENVNILKDERFSKVNDFILNSVEHYLKNIQNIPYEDFWIVSSWINVCPTGGMQYQHCHRNSFFSGCYYLDADPYEHPGLSFFKEEKVKTPFMGYYSHKLDNEISDHAELKVQSNDLVIFPSYMFHGHEINNSQKSRVSLAFNVLFNQPKDLAPRGWYHIRFEK